MNKMNALCNRAGQVLTGLGLCAVSTLERMKGSYLSGLAATLNHEADIMSAQYELARMNPTQAETWRTAIKDPPPQRIAF